MATGTDDHLADGRRERGELDRIGDRGSGGGTPDGPHRARCYRSNSAMGPCSPAAIPYDDERASLNPVPGTIRRPVRRRGGMQSLP